MEGARAAPSLPLLPTVPVQQDVWLTHDGANMRTIEPWAVG